MIYSTEGLRSDGYAAMRSKIKKKRLNSSEKLMIDELCQSVVISSPEELWGDKLISCIKDAEEISLLGTIEGVEEVSIEHDLDLYSAALLFHSSRRG